ncbi:MULTISPECIES: S8 family serine peptidase [Streptomyces]|uniref:cyanobactin maturation protease PatG family protein n=1 Tax=Streptomyces TaxID=1883 RepID=UPI00203583A0|nr:MULTISPECIES: S8 family serine peptidase [Streptomyces]UUA10442.1 S8 family serine peptidase [Streptomyces koelreuteriae]UUA18049.1 S8 family serine peptidase [Streptomyces sp. CRCS-T-1]
MDVRSVLSAVPGQAGLLGTPEVRVAVLDGPVDFAHPCFSGADLTQLATLVPDAAGSGPMSLHGTHVASLLFGQPGSPVAGLLPRCRGFVLPVFRESPDGGVARVPQLDLARAVEQAVEAGAHVINISGGERSADGKAEAMLERALRRCAENGVLVVAAVGNDGCDCLQAPAATPSVLAVGATDAAGEPLDINNWGPAYRTNGVLAPGRDIEGAVPGGRVAALTGSSFATPAVTGVAALLVAQQIAEGREPDPLAAGRAILTSASRPPCAPDDAPKCRRLLGGHLAAARAFDLIRERGPVVPQEVRGDPVSITVGPSTPRTTYAEPKGRAIAMDTNAVHAHAGETPEGLSAAAAPPPATTVTPPAEPPPAPTLPPSVPQTAPAIPQAAPASQQAMPQAPQQVGAPAFQQAVPQVGVQPAVQPMTPPVPAADVPPAPPVTQPASPAPVPVEQGVRPSCSDCGGTCGGSTRGATAATMSGPVSGQGRQLIFAIGTIGFDYRTEARRDSFRQQMPVEFRPATDEHPEQEVQPNVYDPRQLHAYLSKNPWACDKLTWTLNMDATPLYALEAEMPVGMDWTRPIITDRGATPDAVRDSANAAASDKRDQLADIVDTLSYPPVSTVYRTFRDAIVGQVQDRKSETYVSRVSIPGVLTERTVRLFSGQVVPVVEVKSRGLYTWNEHVFVQSVMQALQLTPSVEGESANLEKSVRTFLDKVYWEFRNLGQSSADRALNFAGTNAFDVGREMAEGMAAKDVPGRGRSEEEPLYALDTIKVSKSPFCRPGSDCQDVVMTFFDPENDRRAKRSVLFTYDVSDELPVSLAPPHIFIGGY